VLILAVLIVTSCTQPSTQPPPAAAAWSDGYRVLFVGDVYFGVSYRGLDERILRYSHDAGFGIAKLKPFLEAAHLVIANLETPIIDPTSLPPFEDAIGYHHWTDANDAPERLKEYHFHAVSLGNNHALDQGTAGLEQTLDALAKHDIIAFGAGRTQADAERPFETDLVVGDMVVRLAVFGAFEYFEKYDTRHHIYASGAKPGVARLSADRTSDLVHIYKAAHPASFVIVFPHWGGNYSWKTDAQTPIAKAVLEAGADTVIGHGAHTVQEIERHGGKTVIYNIGDFLFASPGRYGQFDVAPDSFVALLRFTAATGTLRVDARLYPIAVDNQVVAYQPRPLTDAEFAALTTMLAEQSGTRFAERVQTGKDPLGPFFEVRLL
jgi:hypothetical protein